MPEHPPTLLLSSRYSADAQVLWRAAVERGWHAERPVRFTIQSPPQGPVGVFGELTFCDIMAERLRLGLLEPPNAWLAGLAPKYLKRSVWAGTIIDLPKVTERSFVKPANDKLFPAGIYQSGRDVPVRYVDPACPILVSEVVEFEFEVRLYILDRSVVTASHYLEWGMYNEEKEDRPHFRRHHLGS